MSAAKQQLVDIKLLKTLIPLSDLDEISLGRLEGNYIVENLEAGTQLFAQGERDKRTYYLLAGQVTLHFISGLEKVLSAEMTHARRAIVPEKPRTATAIAKTPITVLSFESQMLDDLMSWNQHGYEVSDLDNENDNDWMSLFLQSKVFLKLPAQNIQALMMRMEEITVRAGQAIIRQGDDDGYYYILKRGRCRVTRRFSPQDDEVVIAELSVGSGFGEEAILTHNRRGATVTMIESGCLMRLSRNDFTRLLVEPLINTVKYEDVSNNPQVVFLDVRSYDDFVEDGISKSQNINIAELRPKIALLESNKRYVIVSNTGSRAAAATFLLCQQGIDAVVLEHGLSGLPADVQRGNASAPRGDEIPLVDNVVKFTKPANTAPAAPTGPQVIDPEQAMQDPRVQAMFSKAKRRVQHEAQRAQMAEEARIKAEQEAQRLKQEAEQARLQVEEAQRQVELAAHQSAEAARLEVKKEAARLREMELGAKQAEMEEAVRQAEQEASRAHDAEMARRLAEEEINRLKQEMQQALEQAQEEAKKSAEAMRLMAEQQARKEREEAEQRAAEEARRAQQAEQEIARLKHEAEVTRRQLEQQAKIAADQARSAAEQDAARKQTEELARAQKEAEDILRRAEEEAARAHAAELARQQAEAEIERLRLEAQAAKQTADAVRIAAEQEAARIRAEETAKKQHEMEQAAQKAAELARQQAEKEIEAIKRQAEQERLRLEEQAIRAAEMARTEAVNEAQLKADAEAQRALQAEQARLQAEQEIARLKAEAESARKQIEEQLSSEVARSEIEHEVARARAEELANKQAEIEDMAQKAEEDAQRARAAEEARLKAEAEIERLRLEVEAARKNVLHNATDNFDTRQDNSVVQVLEQKQHEMEEVARRAKAEAERALAAEKSRLDAQAEIERLREEVAVATLQAQAQLSRDAERAIAEEEAIRQRAAVLANKEAEIQAAIQRAEIENARASDAELAHQQALSEIERLRATEVAHQQALEEIDRLKAEAGMALVHAQQQVKANIAEAKEKAKMQVDMAALKVQAEKQRAEQAERARRAAEQEIARLKAEAEQQRLQSEQVIQESIKAAKRQLDKKLLKLRAAEKARKTMDKQRKTTDIDLSRKVKTDAPAQSNWKRPSNVVDGAPLVDILPDAVAADTGIENTESDFAEESAWVSDKVMWETTLGVRDDATVDKLIRSREGQSQSSVHNIPQSQQSQEQTQQQLEKAKFTARDTNPYVNTQRLDEVFRKPVRNKFRKIALAVCVCISLGTAGYYWSLDDADKTAMDSTINNYLSKSPAIHDFTDNMKDKISDLSKKAKESINSINREPATGMAGAQQDQVSEPATSTSVTGTTATSTTAVKNKESVVKVQDEPVTIKPEVVEPPKPALSIEERVKLKMEQSEKALKARIERKREREKAKEEALQIQKQQSSTTPVAPDPMPQNTILPATPEPVQPVVSEQSGLDQSVRSQAAIPPLVDVNVSNREAAAITVSQEEGSNHESQQVNSQQTTAASIEANAGIQSAGVEQQSPGQNDVSPDNSKTQVLSPELGQ